MNSIKPHKLLPELVGRKLNIDVVGCGGNGSQMLTGLARMHLALNGVGHPGLQVSAYDKDTITEANVGRQLFSPSDIGLNKAQVLVHRLNCYFGLEWRAVPALHDCSSGSADVVVGCVDTISSRRSIGKSRCKYWLDLGNKDRTGQVILGMPRNAEGGHVNYPADDEEEDDVTDRRGCYKRKRFETDPTRPRTILELHPELNRGKPKEDNAPSCSLAEALERQDLFINQSVATFALQLLWSFIRNGQTTIQGYYINLESGRVVPIPVPQPKETPGKTLMEVFNNDGRARRSARAAKKKGKR